MLVSICKPGVIQPPLSAFSDLDEMECVFTLNFMILRKCLVEEILFIVKNRSFIAEIYLTILRRSANPARITKRVLDSYYEI